MKQALVVTLVSALLAGCTSVHLSGVNPMQERRTQRFLKEILIPEANVCREMTVPDAVDLCQYLVDLYRPTNGVWAGFSPRILLDVPENERDALPFLTFRREYVSAYDLVRGVARHARLTVTIEGDSIKLRTKGD
jgi:hypothetical protein